MKLVGSVSQLTIELKPVRAQAKRIGFVPTMGALHRGHLSLIERARSECDVVVVSIFVNPLQFAPSEDFETYPRDLPGDLDKAASAGTDFVFAPSSSEMYPPGDVETAVDPGKIGEVYEGEFRKGFFTGVATVCTKLFSIVRPDAAYFGQKDAQQLAVIRRVAADLNLGVEIIGCPTAREDDGLAMSSRNSYLGADEREASVVLYDALREAERRIEAGERSADKVNRTITDHVASEPLASLQYACVVDADSFEPVDPIEGRVVLALAAVVGKTRLIDNVLVNVGTGEPA